MNHTNQLFAKDITEPILVNVLETTNDKYKISHNGKIRTIAKPSKIRGQIELNPGDEVLILSLAISETKGKPNLGFNFQLKF